MEQRVIIDYLSRIVNWRYGVFNEKYRIIPNDVINLGISLEKLGVNGLAWKKDEVKKIVEILRRKKIPVLGGDVYKIVNNKIQSTYDSWFLNNNGKLDFVDKSFKKTISYIEEYESVNCGDNIYVLVF